MTEQAYQGFGYARTSPIFQCVRYCSPHGLIWVIKHAYQSLRDIVSLLARKPICCYSPEIPFRGGEQAEKGLDHILPIVVCQSVRCVLAHLFVIVLKQGRQSLDYV